MPKKLTALDTLVAMSTCHILLEDVELLQEQEGFEIHPKESSTGWYGCFLLVDVDRSHLRQAQRWDTRGNS